MAKLLKLEHLLIDRAVMPAIILFCEITRIRLADLSVYFLVISLLLVVPTGLPLVISSGPLAELFFVASLLSLTVYFALSRSPLRVSRPLWRGVLWFIILRNFLAVVNHDFRPYPFLMWSFMLLSEYVCVIDAYDIRSPRR